MPKVVQKQNVRQSVKVVVQQVVKKTKRRRRAAQPKQAPTVVERFVSHPGFVASGVNYSAFIPQPFDVSQLSQMQIQQQAQRGGGLDTSLTHIKELAPKFDTPLLPDTPRVPNIPILPFPALSPPPKEPRVRQPSQASTDKQKAKQAYEEKFGKPAPKSWSGARIIAELQK